MTKKERDSLIKRLENLIPEAKTFAKQHNTRDEYVDSFTLGVLEAKIRHLIEDLNREDLRRY